MSRTLIEAFPKEKRSIKLDGSSILNISECFTDTIQGENFVGVPSVFLRLQGCVLDCCFCDTEEVWRQGNSYTVKELAQMFYDEEVIDQLRDRNYHLVITGGSPLLQQDVLIEFLKEIEQQFDFRPFVEVENECVIKPKSQLVDYVSMWNNSPKLSNCDVSKKQRYKKDVIKYMAGLENSYFKFVIGSEKDWNEIEDDFLGLIDKEQIVLMPEGQTRKELIAKYNTVVDLCCEKGVRMTNRLHVTIWNKKYGV